MGTTAEKLAYLKETKNQLKQALETPYNIMRDYPALIKKYIDNQPTNTVSDGNCTNALDVPLVRLGVDGNSYQGENPSPENPQDIEVIDGVNLFDKDNSDSFLNGIGIDNGGLVIGISTDLNNSNYIRTLILKCKPSTQYNIQKLASKTLYIYDNDEYPALGVQCNVIANNITTNAKFSFTTSSNAKYIIVKFFNTWASELYSYNEILDSIMITKGTTPKPYLPYGCIGLEQSGKNLANINNIPNNSIINIANNTITLANNSSGIGYIDTSITLKQLCPNLKIDDEVILTFDNTSSSRFNDAIYLDGINEKWNKNTSKTITQTILDSKIILYGGYNETAIISNFIIRLSSTNDTYEPYHSPKVYPINLNGNSIAKVGDVKDLLKIYRNGNVEIENKRNRYVFNGNEQFGLSGASTSSILVAVYGINRIAKEHKGMSSHFILNNQNANIGSFDIYNNALSLRLCVDRSKFADIASFKNWLSQQYNAGTPVYVDYVLEKPQTIKLPPIEPIELWEGTNKFELITNLDTTFEMEYVVDKDYLETQNLLNIVEGENL